MNKTNIFEAFEKKNDIEQKKFYFYIKGEDYELRELNMEELKEVSGGFYNPESKINHTYTKKEIEDLINEIKIVAKEKIHEIQEILRLPKTEKNKYCFEQIEETLSYYNKLKANILKELDPKKELYINLYNDDKEDSLIEESEIKKRKTILKNEGSNWL